MDQSLIDRQIFIYLSSTSFRWYEFLDKSWKIWFKNSLYENVSYPTKNGDEYFCDIIDPLLTISNKPDVVTKDLRNINNCYFIVCYLGKRLTIGTLMELAYCVYNKKLLIVIDKHKIHRDHPWIKYWVKNIVNNEVEAVNMIKNIIWNF